MCPQAIAAFVAAFECRLLVGKRPVCTLGARSALENDDPGSYEVDPCHSVGTPLSKNHHDFADPTRGLPAPSRVCFPGGLGILVQMNKGHSAPFGTGVTERGLYP